MMDWGFGSGWFGFILMVIFLILVIVAIIFLIRWLVVSSRAGSHGRKPEETALEILKKNMPGEKSTERSSKKRRGI